MQRKITKWAVMAGALMVVAVAPVYAAEQAAVQKDTRICLNCHKAEPGQMRAEFDSVAMKSQSIQLKIDSRSEVVRFDSKTLQVNNGAVPGDLEKTLRAIKKGHQVRIVYVEKDGVKNISLLSIKPPLNFPPEKVLKTADVEKMVILGPDKGNYLLVDSRPAPKFMEGAIPTAINIPFPSFKQMTDRLPGDKNTLLVFYCAGITCPLSPNSAKASEALGYRNVKVYLDGTPEWTRKNYTVVTPQGLKEVWMDKELSFILLDLRPAPEAGQGAIKGAVSVPAANLVTALKSFPPKELKPPVIVYDDRGGDTAAKAARELMAAGYTNAKVLTGGIAAWKLAGLPIATETVATTVSYVPKPKPGTISLDEFRKVAQAPAGAVIVDVRTAEECKDGMIKGAINIPSDEIARRLEELPKDKLIITECPTGTRAEMAYTILKEKGYQIKFLDAKVAVNEDGTFELERN